MPTVKRTMTLKNAQKTARLSVMLVVILLAAIKPSLADNGFDRGTPAEAKGGLSALASYAPDKIETVNLANGNLNLHIPLVTVGGRGSASYTIALSYNSKVWTSEHQVDTQSVHHYAAMFGDNLGQTPNLMVLGSGWSILKAPAIKVKKVPIDPHTQQCGINQVPVYDYFLTKVWLVLPDGSEVELRDETTKGAPLSQPLNCTQDDGNRGRVWNSTDGSAITYITNADNGVVNLLLDGWVYTADGTRFKIVGGSEGHCNRIIDRNGNVLDITYNMPQANDVTYKDELGRLVVLHQLGDVTTITINGYDAPARTYTITSDRMGTLVGGSPVNFRADYLNQQLWPRPFFNGDYDVNTGGHAYTDPHTDLFWDQQSQTGSDNLYRIQIDGPNGETGVTRLDLLDGRSLKFHYDPWGELAEIVYAGGGISQIDYGPYGTDLCEASTFAGAMNRGVIQRRLLSDGTHQDVQWDYSDDSYTDGTGTYPGRKVIVTGGGQTLMSESHFFRALNVEYRDCTGDGDSNGTGYEAWQSGKEFRTERRTGTGTQFQVETRDWLTQRRDVAWGSIPFVNDSRHGQQQMANDDRVNSEDMILENNKLKRTTYSYDNFNNVTGMIEYDFGANLSQGTKLRETTRTYVGSLNGYCYTSVYTGCSGSTIADANGIIHMRRLLASETVKDTSGNSEARTDVEYDNYVADGGYHARSYPIRI